jgi:hypothetical protein
VVAFQKAEEVAAEKARVEKAAAVKAAGEKAAADVKVVVLSNIRPRLSLVVRVQYMCFRETHCRVNVCVTADCGKRDLTGFLRD